MTPGGGVYYQDQPNDLTDQLDSLHNEHHIRPCQLLDSSVHAALSK